MAPKPAPDAQTLETRLAALKQIRLPSFRPLRGEYAYTEGPHWLSTDIPDPWDFPFVPARGYVAKGTFPFWERAVPCARQGHFVYYDPNDPTRREFYARGDQWGCGLFFGDFVVSGERVDAYDVMSRQRVAARSLSCVLGWGVGWSRLRWVMPVDRDGRRDLHALADPKLSLDEVRYDVRDGTILLLGLVGWGRVNHWRYVQIFWIPVPLGRAVPR
jgi:hypothetical protein